jgi:hypothetical protein
MITPIRTATAVAFLDESLVGARNAATLEHLSHSESAGDVKVPFSEARAAGAG